MWVEVSNRSLWGQVFVENFKLVLTSTTSSSSSKFLVQDEVAILVNCCDEEAPTFGMPSGVGVELWVPLVVGPGKRMGYAEKVPSGIGALSGRRNPSTAMLMQCRCGS